MILQVKTANGPLHKGRRHHRKTGWRKDQMRTTFLLRVLHGKITRPQREEILPATVINRLRPTSATGPHRKLRLHDRIIWLLLPVILQVKTVNEPLHKGRRHHRKTDLRQHLTQAAFPQTRLLPREGIIHLPPERTLLLQEQILPAAGISRQRLQRNVISQRRKLRLSARIILRQLPVIRQEKTAM